MNVSDEDFKKLLDKTFSHFAECSFCREKVFSILCNLNLKTHVLILINRLEQEGKLWEHSKK